MTDTKTEATPGLKVHEWRMIATATIRQSVHADFVARQFTDLEHRVRRKAKADGEIHRWVVWMKWGVGGHQLYDCGPDDPGVVFLVLHAQMNLGDHP